MTTSKATVTVTLCTDEDLPECFQATSKGFGREAPFFDAYFLDHDTESGQKMGSKRLLEWKQASPESSFLKAIIPASDGHREIIIGHAVWTYMTEPPSAQLEELEDVDRFWPNEDDREYMKALWKDYVIPRGQAVADSKGNGVYVLELLAVHPDYQRQGAGSALVRWGTSKASQLGIEAVVEGTPIGRKTYENCGFRAEIEEMRFDAAERFANRTKPLLVFLRKGPDA